MIDDEVSSSYSESDCDSCVSAGGSENNYAASFPNFDFCIYPLQNFHKKTSKFNFEKGKFKFSDGQGSENLPKFPPEKCYWHYLAQKSKANKYSEEFISHILNKRTAKIAGYFKRLRLNQLTKKELTKKMPTNFYGPYWPTPVEIERLNSLLIKINWSIPKIHVNLNYINTPKFSNKELEYLIKRWGKFQKKYNLYDLRPILGVRCGSYDEDCGFQFFKLIDHHCYISFLQWMGKKLPNQSLYSIRRKLVHLIDWYHESKFHVNKKCEISGVEFRCIEVIYDRYGYDSALIMEFLIGKRYKVKYNLLITKFAAIKHIPIKFGKLSKQEDLEIIRHIVNSQGCKDLYELLTCSQNKKTCFFELFNVMKTRTPIMLLDRWNVLKKILTSSVSLNKDKSADHEKMLKWTHEDNVNLICKVYETKAECMTDVNWFEIAKFFPNFCDLSVKSKFYFMLKTRVPMQNHKNFNESLEFLYHNVTPVLKLKQWRQCKLKQDLSYAFDLQRSIEKSVHFADHFEEEEIEDHEDDSRILSELKNENPLIDQLNISHNFGSAVEGLSKRAFRKNESNEKISTVLKKCKRVEVGVESLLENDGLMVNDNSESTHLSFNVHRKKKRRTNFFKSDERNNFTTLNEL